MRNVSALSKLLFDNTHTLVTLMTHELGKFGITLPQAFLLDAIQDRPKTIGEISKLIDLSYSTVSGIADRLEKYGIVTRYRDEKDRRVVWVKLSDKSEELEKTFPVLNEEYFPMIFSNLLEGITEEEAVTLYRSLLLLNSYLDKYKKKGS